MRRVQQVADQLAHVIRLLVDDPEELQRLGRAQRRRCPQHRGGGALDRGQRGLELMAHHAQKLGPEHLHLLERRQVLQSDDQRIDLALLRADGRGVDERGDLPTVRNLEDDHLGADRRGLGQDLLQGRPVQRHLPSVRTPHAEHLQQIFRRLAWHAQVPDDTPRLTVQRRHLPASGVEHQHAHRRRVDQRFQVGPCPLLVSVVARVGDRRTGLCGEEHQDLLVLAGELPAALLVGEVEVADMHAPVTDRRPKEALRRRPVVGEAERAQVGRQVPEPEWMAHLAEVFTQLRPVGQLQEPAGARPGSRPP